jgi:hypothetical protein
MCPLMLGVGSRVAMDTGLIDWHCVLLLIIDALRCVKCV